MPELPDDIEHLKRLLTESRAALFAGSDDGGGERAAAIYTLLGTAKLNGLDPHAYLRDVLDRNVRSTSCYGSPTTKSFPTSSTVSMPP